MCDCPTCHQAYLTSLRVVPRGDDMNDTNETNGHVSQK